MKEDVSRICLGGHAWQFATGLGLSMVYSTVKRHRGKLEIHSELVFEVRTGDKGRLARMVPGLLGLVVPIVGDSQERHLRGIGWQDGPDYDDRHANHLGQRESRHARPSARLGQYGRSRPLQPGS